MQPDPLVLEEAIIDFDSNFDNIYTFFYKFGRSIASPITRLFSYYGENNDLKIESFGRHLYNEIQSNKEESHEKILIRSDIFISQNIQSFSREYFLYDYVRAAFHVYSNSTLENVPISTDEIVDKIMLTINSYYSNFQSDKKLISVSQYNDWIKKMVKTYRYELILDVEKSITIDKIQSDLHSVEEEEWFDISSSKILNETYRYRPIPLSNEKVVPELGDYIFNNIVLSDRVPFVSYTSKEESFYKVYTGYDSDLEPNYRQTVNISKRGSKEDTLEITLWLGSGNLYNTTNESFFTAIYNLHNNTLTFSIPIILRDKLTRYESIAGEALNKALGKIFNIGKSEVIQSKVELFLYPRVDSEGKQNPENGVFNLEHFMLLHSVLLDERYKNIIYPDETLYPLYKRSRYELLYVPMFRNNFKTDQHRPILWSISLKKMVKYSTYTLDFNREITGRGGNYLRLKVIDAENIETANSMLSVLVKLLCVYYREVILGRIRIEKQGIRNLYSQMFDNLEFQEDQYREFRYNYRTEGENSFKSEVDREGVARLKKYREKYPDVFTEHYSKVCPSYKTPEIFESESKAREWSSLTGKKILYYPGFKTGSSGGFWFGCPHSTYIYPNVVANKDRGTRDIIPYFPCCSRTDRSKEGVRSDYNEFYKGEPRIFGPGNIPKKPGKFLRTNEIGEIDTELEEFLNSYKRDAKTARRGVIDYPSPNSFLHCILYAIDDKTYMSMFPRDNIIGRKKHLLSLERREDYVKEIRKKIAISIYPGLLKQELFDRTSDRIQKTIENVENFFDPSLFYRAIEELYQVNIFIFSGNGYELPRHRQYSVKHFNRNRPSILIYKSFGSKTSSYSEKYPHCELIVGADENERFNVKYHDLQMGEHCHNIHMLMSSTVVFSTDKVNSSIQGYNNIFDLLNYQEIFKPSIISQHIDSYGKVRALNVKFTSGTMTVFVPPGQPLNIPETKDIIKTSLSSSTRVFDEKSISSVTYFPDGNISGVWFKVLDIENCFYVMINKEKVVGKIPFPRGPTFIPITEGKSETLILREQKRTLSVIVQLVEWVFDIGRSNDQLGTDINFINNILGIISGPAPKTSVGHYNLTKLRKIYPKVSNYIEAMEYLYKNTGNLVGKTANGYIFTFHNLVFRNKIARHIKVYFKNSLADGRMPKKVIEGYRSTYKSFASQKGVEVFITRHSLNLWLEGRKTSNQQVNEIHDKILQEYSSIKNPYFYMGVDSQIYLIQNVRGKSTGQMSDYKKDIYSIKELRLKAAKVSLIWQKYRNNLGYDVLVDNQDVQVLTEQKLAVYTINSTGNLSLSFETGNQGITMDVLQYGDKIDIDLDRASYAAILKLD